MTVSRVSKSAEDVHSVFSLGVYVLCVLSERRSCVVCHSKNCGCVVVRDGCVVKGDMGVRSVFSGVGCGEC